MWLVIAISDSVDIEYCHHRNLFGQFCLRVLSSSTRSYVAHQYHIYFSAYYGPNCLHSKFMLKP